MMIIKRKIIETHKGNIKENFVIMFFFYLLKF